MEEVASSILARPISKSILGVANYIVLKNQNIYILIVYTNNIHMDAFNNIILCKNCERKTEKGLTIKEGFKIRTLKCPNCNEISYHPLDLKEYDDFQRLRQKNFNVKLRLVGNSFCVSIPREILEFAEMEKQMNKIIRMSLEEPHKLSLFLRELEDE